MGPMRPPFPLTRHRPPPLCSIHQFRCFAQLRRALGGRAFLIGKPIKRDLGSSRRILRGLYWSNKYGINCIECARTFPTRFQQRATLQTTYNARNKSIKRITPFARALHTSTLHGGVHHSRTRWIHMCRELSDLIGISKTCGNVCRTFAMLENAKKAVYIQ